MPEMKDKDFRKMEKEEKPGWTCPHCKHDFGHGFGAWREMRKHAKWCGLDEKGTSSMPWE